MVQDTGRPSKTSTTDAAAFPPSPLAQNGTGRARRGQRGHRAREPVWIARLVRIAAFVLCLRRLPISPSARGKCCLVPFNGTQILDSPASLSRKASEKQYAYDVCGRKYTEKKNLVIHSRSHTGERPFECSSCPATFTSSERRKRHMLTHTGERPHECNECGRRFATTSSLARHVPVHSGKKAFACHVCGRKFSQRGTLQRHARTHTGEKPYVCHLCPTTFALLSTLKGHVARHTGERPHKCNICGQRVAGKPES
ncbi:hypothetical protein HPB52_013726 [Rhipicephalus sanguineus]|uniref:C2H2-type domain-containing protein n=1 Tax=Rhipicephalus sanguineus TaxID=34632 RepID=A0A9D4PJV9_RHISA|nr:hypothetical protein HPB52_013726 [Rhipicephalus sanguineus]